MSCERLNGNSSHLSNQDTRVNTQVYRQQSTFTGISKTKLHYQIDKINQSINQKHL